MLLIDATLHYSLLLMEYNQKIRGLMHQIKNCHCIRLRLKLQFSVSQVLRPTSKFIMLTN